MKLHYLTASHSRKGGWIVAASNQVLFKRILATLPEDAYRLTNKDTKRYWMTEQSLLRIQSAFENWHEFAPLLAPPSQKQAPVPSHSRSQAQYPPLHYHLSVAQAPTPTQIPQQSIRHATTTVAAAAALARQADTFDIILISQGHHGRVTLQLARELATAKYQDIIAALQLLFRDVSGDEITNPREGDEEVQTLLRTTLRPLALLNIDAGQLLAEYRRAVIAALEGEEKAAAW